MKNVLMLTMCGVVLASTLMGCSDSDETSPAASMDTQSDTATAGDASQGSDALDVDASSELTQPSPTMSVVDEEVASFLEDNPAIEGATVLVIHRDKGVLHRRAYGAFDEERLYFVASSSKMVAAGMLNRLHDDGVLDIYKPLTDIVDWGTKYPDITPVHLISNSSGLPGLSSETAPLGHGCQYEPDGELEACAKEIFEAEIAPSDTIVAPDTEYRYGGGQWQIAGGIAETASGKSWAQLFTEIYAEPCDLKSSGFAHQYHFPGQEGAAQNGFPYPHPFDSNLDNIVPTENPLIEGGMYTSMDDYGKLLMMHLKGGLCGENRVHESTTIERMHADRIKEAYDGVTEFDAFGLGGYGMGWFVDRSTGDFSLDPGAYGTYPYIDWKRNIAVFTALEESVLPEGLELYLRLRPAIEEAVDAMSDEP